MLGEKTVALSESHQTEFLNELDIERERWRAKLLTAIRPITAVLALIGLVVVLFLMVRWQRLLPLIGLSILLLASILPGLGTRTRSLLLILSLAAMCILGIPSFGLAPNLFSGLLVATTSALLLLRRRQAAVAYVFIASGLIGMGIALITKAIPVSPLWLLENDAARPANVVRVSIFFLLTSGILAVMMSHVLRQMERLLLEKSVALYRLREETAAKEDLKRELASREKIEARARELELLGRLASYFGHDTNNALLAVWSSLDVLRDPLSSQQRKNEALATLGDAATHIRDISSQLRSFGPGRRPSPGTAHLPTVVRGIERLLKQILPDTVTVTIGPVVDIQVAMEATELQRILTNLALNARDAMRDNGTLVIETQLILTDGKPELELKAKRAVAIHVADTGVGISKDLQERIFEPFFTTKGAKGTGLGLSSVKESLEMCGGRVTVHSQMGLGTTFKLLIPAAEAFSEERRRTRELPVSAAAVLVVEESLVRNAIVRALRSRALGAHGVESPEDGITFLASHTEPIALLLVGDLDCTKVRDLVVAFQRRYPGGRVLYCADGELVGDGICAPITNLPKPFTLTELLRAVEQQLAVASASAQPLERREGDGV